VPLVHPERSGGASKPSLRCDSQCGEVATAVAQERAVRSEHHSQPVIQPPSDEFPRPPDVIAEVAGELSPQLGR
jgi:hypothetical protein